MGTGRYVRQGRIGMLVMALALFAAPGADAKISIAQKSFQLGGKDSTPRLEVGCPGKSLPYGGGMYSTPGIGADGEGVYPHSYERLGVQHGWHVTPVLFSPSGSPATRTTTLQVTCGPRTGQVAAPHTTTYIAPGEVETAVARCPKGSSVFSGGFQRTDFVSRGGNYVTESKAEGTRAWTVTGTAFGSFGGELTAIAYCLRGGKKVSESTATSSSASSGVMTATSPPCAGDSSLVAGGFSFNGSTSAFFGDGILGRDGGWTAQGYNNFGRPTAITAIGYCMSKSVQNADHGRQKGKHGGKGGSREVRAPRVLDAALKVAISARVSDPNNCFPAPDALAGQLNAKGINAGVVGSVSAVGQPGKVFVISGASACDRVTLAVKTRGYVYTIDSQTGKVTRK